MERRPGARGRLSRLILATTLGLTVLGASACDKDEATGAPPARRAQAPAGAMNVVVVVMDSLRADHIYGPRARTATLDAFARESLRFRNAYPEGMPTIPARRAIMSGRRTFPFRGWHPYKGLPPQPGWEPVGSDGEMFTEYLRGRGWTVFGAQSAGCNPIAVALHGDTDVITPVRPTVPIFCPPNTARRPSAISGATLLRWLYTAVKPSCWISISSPPGPWRCTRVTRPGATARTGAPSGAGRSSSV